jgi:hypothetical protein
MLRAARPAGREAEPLSREAIQAVSPTVLPATVRRQVFLLLGILVVLVAVGSPSGGMFGIAIPLLL